MSKYRDPIHGFIEVNEWENEIINSKPFQRLRNIKQLAFTYLVYHGAEHSRFGHSIGVMHVASRAFDAAVANSLISSINNSEKNRAKVEWLRQILRFIALTHDLGHAPFSHASESVFPKDKNGKAIKHEYFTEKIIEETIISDIINKAGKVFKTRYGDEFDITPELICGIYSGKNPGKNSEFTFLNLFMDSELDCDKMDYLLRDSYYCGVSYGNFDLDRLINSLTIIKKEKTDAPGLAIKSGGTQAFEAFVLARYFMFVQVYFQHTRRYYDKALERALKAVLPKGYPKKTEEYLEYDDVKVISLLKTRSKKPGEGSVDIEHILNRKSYKNILTTQAHPDPTEISWFNSSYEKLKIYFKTEKKLTDAQIEEILFRDDADKYPHKINPQKFEIDEEEAVFIYDTDKKAQTTIAAKSKIISHLTEEIRIRRALLHRDYYDEKVKEIVKI
ncbi:MAG: HD domain-containing protein [Clostridiales bacterium]|jgi:HD superfamily phosphohydrolase|nr:HD domain-containing protein [Clostridiales bacterium]